MIECVLGYVPVLTRSLYFKRSRQYCSTLKAARSWILSFASLSAFLRKASALSLRISASSNDIASGPNIRKDETVNK